MRVLRFAIGFVFLTSSAASVACAQQATACAKQKEEDARREREVAHAHLERALQETETARACVERDLEATAEARACAERGLQEAEAACAASADAKAKAKAKKIRHYHLQDSERLAEEALRACEVAEHVQEALARHQMDLEALNAPEMKLHLEALAAMAELQEPSEMEPVLALDRDSHLGGLLAGLAQQDGSSERLKDRIRALEERLGIDGERPGRSLEDRVEELERRTMAGEERRARAPKEPASQGGRFERRRGAAPVPPAQGGGAHGGPGTTAPEPRGLGMLLGRRPGPVPTQPVEPMTAPHPLDQPFPPMEAPPVPAPPEAPEPARFHRRDHGDDAEPSAPRLPPASGGHGLTPDRRREIEEVMQRMRGEMERLREEMSQLREQLGNDQPRRSLRGLGYIDGRAGSGAR